MALRFRPANRRLMREINESIVLGLIRQHGPISRVDIARAAHLSAATVTGITTTLLVQGLVIEEASGVSTGGRRPIPLAFNRRAGVALGVKVTERALVCSVTDLGGAIEEHVTIAQPAGATPDQVVSLIAAEVDRIRRAWPERRMAGVGIGIAGVVDRPSGVSRLSPFLRWHDVPLREMVAQAISAPVVVENDVNALTFAFHAQDARLDRGSFMLVTIGRGIGLGMMLNGVPFRGARGQGGELGHVTMEPDGPLCECGKRGCLEAIASLPSLVRDAGDLLGEPIDETTFRDLVSTGDPRITPVTDRAADILGQALATLVNLLNPNVIVLSGEGAWLAKLLLPRILENVHVNTFDRLADGVDVQVEERGDEFWAAGAAGVLLEETFRPQLERAHDAPRGGER